MGVLLVLLTRDLMEMQDFTLTGRRIWADFSNGITVQVFEGGGLDLSPGPLLRKITG